ncbi:MAG: hypothetical protein RIM23_09675 [Coleofasciculus sp. G3-WIS-01]|uniref:hypothetical protein n=1 Tax=Coleofasciculus sp. G3-WIS-01 TaxID=3069528 RepID=UPI0032F6F2EB
MIGTQDKTLAHRMLVTAQKNIATDFTDNEIENPITAVTGNSMSIINYPDLLRAEVWVFSSPEVIEQAKLNILNSSA